MYTVSEVNLTLQDGEGQDKDRLKTFEFIVTNLRHRKFSSDVGDAT